MRSCCASFIILLEKQNPQRLVIVRRRRGTSFEWWRGDQLVYDRSPPRVHIDLYNYDNILQVKHTNHDNHCIHQTDRERATPYLGSRHYNWYTKNTIYMQNALLGKLTDCVGNNFFFFYHHFRFKFISIQILSFHISINIFLQIFFQPSNF